MSEADSKRYAQALGNALRHLPLKTTQKAVDFAALAMCAFEMEVPRITKSIVIARQPAPQQRGGATGGIAQVFRFNPPGSPPPAAAVEPDLGGGAGG